MIPEIKKLSEAVNLCSYEEVLVNMNGGMFLFGMLAAFQQYEKQPTFIKYHRPKAGHGAIVMISVPVNCINKKVLILDDILDSGGVLREIFKKVGPQSEAAVIVTKRGIDGQYTNGNIHIAAEIDDVWVGGCGMNLGVEDENHTFREYPGIVVKKVNKLQRLHYY